MAARLPSAASLLGRLRFAQKIGLVALLLLLPLAFITWGYLDIQRGQVAFSEKEREGTAYLRPLLDLTGRAVQARHLAVSGGDPASVGIAQGIEAVNTVEGRHGATLETAQVWATARSALQEAQAAGTPADALARYNDAVTALLNVVIRVSDKSNLTLDPDLDSYYVMDALVFRLPLLLDSGGRAVDQALVIRGAPAPQVDAARIDLAIVSGAIASARDAFATGMQTAFASTSNEPLKGTTAQVSAVLDAVGAELTQITDAVRGGRLETIDATAADRSAQSIGTLVNALVPVLDELLVTRIGGFENKAYRVQGAVVVALIGAFLLFGFYRGTTVPLRRMVTALRALASGDLTTRVPVETSDEIGTMGNALNEAIDRVRQAMEVLRNSADGLAGSSSQLSGVSRGLRSAAEATSAQAGGVTDEATRVTHHLEEVGAGTAAIDRAVHDITAGVAEASDVTQQAAAATAASNEAVGRLGRSSAEIGEVVGVITSIAGQINLLSLNATIEAARAGEAGRGFAVVAGEVKDLSQETARATDDITARVEAIQADTGAAIAAIGHIGEIIARIDAIQAVIAAAVDEQVTATRSMGRNVAEVTAGSAGITTGLTAVTRSADNTAADAEVTQRAADALAATAEDLRQIVGQFRTAD